MSFYHYKRNRQNSATFSPPVGSQVEPSSYEFEEGPPKKILVFEVRHWISNHEAGIGEPKAGNTVGTTFYGSQGYLSMWDGRRELFNLREDVSETRNLVEKEPAIVRRMAARLDEGQKKTGAILPGRNPAADPAWPGWGLTGEQKPTPPVR